MKELVARLLLAVREICVAMAIYLALMAIPALYLTDAIWNGGRLASALFP